MRRSRVATFSRRDWDFGWTSPQEQRQADAFYADLMGLQLPGRDAHGRSRPTSGGRFETEADAAEAAPVTLPAGFRMGVWLDVGGKSLADNGATHASRLHALGIADACIMINPLDSTSFGFGSVSQARIRAFAALLRGSAIQLTLTSWLRPNRTFIDQLVRDLPPFAQEIGARAIEFDVEEPWTSNSPSGFTTHDEAADYLFAGLRRASAPEVAVTCQVDQTDRARMRAIVRQADLVIPQAYSTTGTGASHAVGGVYGPRGLQRRAAQKVADAVAASGKPVIMGLAAYGRTGWSGHSARDIMTMELEEAVTLTSSHAIRGARYWSWKHIAGFNGRLGNPANSYANSFLQDIALPPP